MRAFALTCEVLSHLDSIEGKVQCAAAYLISRPIDEVSLAARFLSGSPLPHGTPPPKVGAASISEVVGEQCGLSSAAVRRRAVKKGDLGTAAQILLQTTSSPTNDLSGNLTLKYVAQKIAKFGVYSPVGRAQRLRQLYASADPLEAKYLTKLLVGALRTGMQAGRVEEAISLAFDEPLDKVRRAHMLIGDIGEVAERAWHHELTDIRLRPFRPVRCMLAHPAANTSEILEHLELPVIAESKLDGIRAQLHVSRGRCRQYARSLEEVTHLFPELNAAVEILDDDWILDGEIVAWQDGPLAFEELQQRLGRRQVPLTLLLDVPVVYHAFDVLRASGKDLIDEPLSSRKQVLGTIPNVGAVRRIEHELATTPEAVGTLLETALEAGQEGVIFKDPKSTYHPGSRGRAWLKLKRPLGTLDVVVTAAQYGRGNRAGWLSDMTFAIRGEDGNLIDIGKAYTGLTHPEIRTLTEHFKATTSKRSGDVHEVQPTVILEVAFGGIQRSNRYASGFALRFPRIVRQRKDLGPR
ncbi:MAG: ATP-dependent DNA ligase, partial [Acidobacteriota bacterium]|nr:ATP-dependent DNA ligase [Acidobacteriota bacterium]